MIMIMLGGRGGRMVLWLGMSVGGCRRGWVVFLAGMALRVVVTACNWWRRGVVFLVERILFGSVSICWSRRVSRRRIRDRKVDPLDPDAGDDCDLRRLCLGLLGSMGSRLGMLIYIGWMRWVQRIRLRVAGCLVRIGRWRRRRRVLLKKEKIKMWYSESLATLYIYRNC
jgi:hypothetical protein